MEIGDITTLIFLGFTGFMAAFIDSMVGGGGHGSNIQFPRLPAFRQNGCLAQRLFPLSLMGSAVGVLLVRSIPPDFLRPFVVTLLIAVTLYSIFKKDWGMEAAYKGIIAQTPAS